VKTVSKRTAGLAAVAVAVSLAAACSSPAPGSQASGGTTANKVWVVGYSQSNNAEPYRQALNAQLTYYMKKYKNVKLLPIADGENSVSKQVQDVQNFIAQRVNVLIVSPNQPDPLTAPVQAACAAHIPVIILDRSVNTSCYTTFIGGNNLQEGQLQGQYAVKALPGGGNVVELSGTKSDLPAIQRDAGFRQAVDAHNKTVPASKQIKILSPVNDDKWLRPNAEQDMQQWLQKGVKINLVYAENDDMAIGAYLSAAAAHRAGQMKFVGGDGLATPGEGLDQVKEGHMNFSVVYPTCAQQAAQIVEKLSKHQSVPHNWSLPITPVTSANVNQLLAEYNPAKFS
jgi:ribose transport system substrate-binding protein